MFWIVGLELLDLVYVLDCWSRLLDLVYVLDCWIRVVGFSICFGLLD